VGAPSDRPVHGRVLPGTVVLATTAAVAVLLGAISVVLVWRTYQTSVEGARRVASSFAYDAAVSASSYVKGRVDLLATYATRAAFVVGDPSTVGLELSAVPPGAGFDAGVVWYDAEGVLRAGVAVEPATDPVLAAEVAAVLRSGEERVTPVITSPELTDRAVVLLVPTVDSAGGVNGVLGGAISTTWIDAAAEEQANRRGTSSFVFDRTGAVVAADGPHWDAEAPRPVPADPDSSRFVTVRARTGATDPLGRSSRTIGYATEHLLTGWTSVEVTSDAAALGPARRSLLQSLGGVAMFVGAAVLGATAVALRSNELARRARRAEEHLRRSEAREREVATTLQASLLPRRVVAVPGLDVVTRYRPAGPDLVVGGDFFDVAELGDDRWQVLVGDVCGHGVRAAAATSLARHTLRVAGRHVSGPATWLRWLHQELASLGPDDFVTAIALELRRELDGFVVRFAVAGHPLPLLAGADGEVTPVGSPGTLLGVVTPELRETELVLGPGDRLLLYTDGLTDSLVPRLADDDVVDAVRANLDLDTRRLADLLLGMSAPSGPAPYDDTALVVLAVPLASPLLEATAALDAVSGDATDGAEVFGATGGRPGAALRGR
jgi:serine phosphatase RsbU (regulator of sigma subunit)